MYFYASCGQATTPLIQKGDLYILPEAILRRGEPVCIIANLTDTSGQFEGHVLAPYSYLVLS